MDPIRAKRIATTLEIVSFFCVTLDIYGARRIEQLDEKLKAYIGRIRELPLAGVLLRIVLWPFSRAVRVAFYGEMWSGGCVGYLEFVAFLLIYGVGYSDGIIPFAINSLISLLFGAVVFVIAALAIEILLYILEFILDKILRFSLFLLVRLNLNGFLVLFGTLMFLVSNGITLLYP